MTIYYSRNTYMCVFKFWNSQKNFSFQEKTEKTISRWQFIILKIYIHIHVYTYINFETVKKMFLFYFRWLCNTIPVEISMRVILYYIIQKSSQEMTIRTEAQSVREIGNNLCLPVCVYVRARTRKRNGDRDDHRCKLRYRAV